MLLALSLPPSGLGGGSASGKTTVARMIIEALDVPWVVLLSMDSFYKVSRRQLLSPQPAQVFVPSGLCPPESSLSC